MKKKINDDVKKNRNNIKEILRKVGKFFTNKKVIYVIIALLFILIISFVIYKAVDKNNNKSTISYNEIKGMVDNKDDFLIYYYNSNSKNKNNRNIKKYLDELGIRYYNYNDVYVDREEYDNFLKLINIDNKIFGTPALIYINDGIMYANLINIDSKKVVENFIDTYDLYTIK